MTRLIVLENPARWPVKVPGAEVVTARDYLVEPRFAALPRARVFNLCRTSGYQTLGYYVSLLAAARGHRPLPSLADLQDLRQGIGLRPAARDLNQLVQRSLGKLRSERFELSVYFGRNLAARHEALARALFARFPAPLLRATFRKGAKGRWRLEALRPLALEDVPEEHQDFLAEQATRYFQWGRAPRPRRRLQYELAILANPEEEHAPSNAKALDRFVSAAAREGIQAVRIGREDAGRVAEFDALFLRETTSVDHPTYRLARRAAREGLVVVDDPESILRCTNKVFLAEAFRRAGVPHPRTLVIHEESREGVGEALGFPLVVKAPDSSFSLGVRKARDPEELARVLDEVLEESELVVAQEFTPSDFDWRVGVLGGEPLWACKYHMARGHWTIQATTSKGGAVYGKVETLPVADVPPVIVETALQAAGLIGDGLYGVDLKEVGGKPLVMEVNDNPNLDAGYEDRVLGAELYRRVMAWFRARLDARGKRS